MRLLQFVRTLAGIRLLCWDLASVSLLVSAQARVYEEARTYRQFDSIGFLILIFGLAIPSFCAAQVTGEVVQKKASLGTSNVETLQVTSKVFSNTRTVRILLPPGYHDPKNATKRYPVLYLTDGIMVFRPNRLNIEEVVHNLIQKGDIPPIIVVGIDNGGATDKTKNSDSDRANEFLPYPDVGFSPDHLYAPDPPNPQGKLYPRFLIDEVLPLVKRYYRIKTGHANTGLGGFSYGGVAALYTAMNRPDIFGKLLLESTPLWIGPDKQLLKDAKRIKNWPISVYIGVGTKETADDAINNEGKRDIESLRLIIMGKSPKTTLKIVSQEGATHQASAWRSRLPFALQFLFGNIKQ